MLKNELYKVFSKKIFFVLLAAVLIVNTVLFISENRQDEYQSKTLRDYRELLLSFEDKSRAEISRELEEIERRLSVYSEVQMYEMFDDPEFSGPLLDELKTNYPDYYADYYAYPEERNDLLDLNSAYYMIFEENRYIDDYPEYIASIEKQAEDMRKVSIFRQEGSFSYNNIMKTPEDFNGLEQLQLKLGPSEGVIAASTFRTTDALILIMAFFICFILFLQEKESGTLNLLRSAKNGRFRLVLCKLSAVSILIVSIAALAYGSVIISAYTLYDGFGDLTRYVQSMSEFSRCTLPITVSEYMILFFFSKIAAILLATLLFAVVFSFSKGSGQAYFLMGVLIIANLGAYALIPALSYFNIFKYLSFFELTDTFSLYANYNNINLFSLPIERISFSYGFALMTAVLAVAGTVWAFVAAKELNIVWLSKISDRIARFMSRFSGGANLFVHENYKLYISGKALAMLLLAVIIGYNTMQSRELFLYTTDELYLEHIEVLQGELNDEKIAYVAQKRAELDDISNQINALSERYMNGEISMEMMTVESQMLSNMRETLERPLEIVEKQLAYLLELKETRGIVGAFTNIRYTDEYFTDYQDSRTLSLMVMFLLIIAVSYPFCSEYRSDMVRIITAAKNGKSHLFWAKYGTAALYTILLWLIVYSRELIDMLRYFPIGEYGAPIQSIERFAAIPIEMSIFEYLLMMYLLRLFGALVTTAVTLAFSILLKRRAFAILASLAVCVMPMLLQLLNLQDLSAVTLNGAFLLNETAQRDGGFAALAIYLPVVLLLTGVLVWFVKREFCNQRRRS